MPSFNTAGKSKEDLAIVAQLAGLLSIEESARMSRAELVKFLSDENRKSEKAGKQTIEEEPLNSSRGRSRKNAGKPVENPAVSEPVAKPLAKGRPARSLKAVEQPVLEVAVPQESLLPEVTESPIRHRGRISKKIAQLENQPPNMPETAAFNKKPMMAAKLAKLPKPRRISKDQPIITQAEPEMDTSALAFSGADVQEKSPVILPSEPAEPILVPEKVAHRRGRRPKGKPEDAVHLDVSADNILPAAETQAEQPAVVTMPEQPEQISEDGRSTRRPSTRRKPELAEQKTEPEQTSFIPEAELQESAPGHLAEKSPEASGAASDIENEKELAPDRPGVHHVSPHHTLKSSKTGPRRTTRMIGEAGSTGKPGASGQTDYTYPESGEQGDNNENPDAASDQTATNVPLLPGQDATAPKGHRPIIETGDIQAGVLEIMPDGYGFLRKENYLQGTKDIYVPPQYIRRFGLRPGDYVTGPVKLQRESDRYQALLYIKDVNGQLPEKMLRRPHFDRLTPIYPDERFVLETVRNELSTRIIDLVAPIGRGQRGMIVSPPKAGKTILLQKIANAISTNNPDVKLIVLLIDERPEEVTDMQRSINGEVVYSTFDKTPENHTKVTELVLERAMRLVELKQDVVILLDSMTRLARAYNLTINPTGRTLSGGLDPGALYGPKRFFGAARNIENGGSLTIIATSLIETGSRMDEVIFEEFKGTGNMEVYLDRKMSEKRIFPAIDINKSGTRREELLMTTKELDAVWTIRKAFGSLDTTAVTEAIINLLLKTKNNEHFISSVNVSFNDKNVFEAMRGVRPTEISPNTRSNYNNTGYSGNYRRQQGPEEET